MARRIVALQTKHCVKCGTVFVKPIKVCQKAWDKQKHCSRKCSCWNAGLTKETSPTMAKIAADVAIASIGRPSWSKGKTKHTDPRLMVVSQKVAVAQLGKTINENQKRGLAAGRTWAKGLTKETNTSIKARSKYLSSLYAGKKNPEHSERLKALYAEKPELHPNSVVARKTKGKGYTGIERKVADHLTELGVEYKFNERTGTKWPDFRIDSIRLIIEADGERWHQDARREAERDAYLQGLGWRVLHISCKIIDRDPERCRALIVEAINQT